MDLKAFLRAEVKPALGCTEPGAVALAAATAAKEFSGTVEGIQLRLSANVFKNGHHVGIPGTGGLQGNRLAAALGALAGNPTKGLRSLEDISREDVEQARKLVEAGGVTEQVVNDVPSVYAEVELQGPEGSAGAVISGSHDRVTEVRKNGKVVRRLLEADTSPQGRPGYLEELMRLDMGGLWALAGTVDDEMEAFLLEGARMNMEVAEKGLQGDWSVGVVRTLQEQSPSGDLLWAIKATASAAADARMGGASLPVMSSAGSGNHGITAVIPVVVAARHWKSSSRALAEALALSHLVTGFLKAHTGRLTPICGCAVAAGSGAAAGLVRLAGGTASQGDRAVASLVASLVGMLCDGAKGSCALKVGSAAGEAYTSALLALANRGVGERQGVVYATLPETARAVGTLSALGFSSADSVMLRLLGES